jgi:hypothetical protein
MEYIFDKGQLAGVLGAECFGFFEGFLRWVGWLA